MILSIDDIVTIIPSVALSALKLDALCKRHGKVTEVKQNGCWVRLDEEYMDELEWYIPNISLVK